MPATVASATRYEGFAGRRQRHTLAVLGANSVANLPTVPTSEVEFHVNREQVFQGITNAEQIVTIDATALGFPITLSDEIVATYW